jgi:hypothetical protein
MPLQKRPVHSLDDINQRRRDREVLNQVLDHSFDDSRRQTDAEKLAGVTPINPAYPPYHIWRYGADPTGVNDSQPAIQAAVDAATLAYHSAVMVPCGIYRMNSGVVMGEGIKIKCESPQGSNSQYGVSFRHYANGDCFTWNGNGRAFAGTGGGLIGGCYIQKEATFTTGRAIYVVATDDDHRPGQMAFDTILIAAETGGGLWDIGVEIDGTACDTPGGRGVRTTRFNDVRVAACTTNNKYFFFNQATHLYGNIQMDTGTGTGTLGMTIDGDWDHIFLDVRVGNVIVNYTGSGNPDLQLSGSCDTLDINSTAIIGTATIKATSGITNQATLFRISSWIVDDFTAFVSNTVGNTTGDGTAYTVIFDTESYDPNGCHNSATGVYTVKVAGICDLDWCVVLTSLGAAHTTGELVLDHRDSGGSSRNQIHTKYNVGAMRDAANQCSISNSIKLKVFEGDTLRVTMMVSGSTKTVGIGGAATRYTWFSAKTLA